MGKQRTVHTQAQWRNPDMPKSETAKQSSEEATPLYAPTMEDIVQKLHGCKYFSALDQSSGYWNIEVHPDSVHLLTFNTPFGRYAYKRLPLGLVSSQDVFQ